MEGRILVVDDDEVNRKLVVATLSRAGYEMVTANDGPEALQCVEQTRFDLVILDVMMPGMDGFEVCSRLRHNPQTAHIPIMMLTALDTVADKIRGLEAGADEYLPKPFSPDILQAHVKAMLRRAAAVAVPAEAPQQQLGKVIAVFSLRGGAGVSTLAANLSVALAQLWGQPAVLVDLALTAGQAALMLNLPLRRTWGNLAQIPLAEMESDLINETLMPHSSGAHVLAAAPRPHESEYLTAEKVAHVLDLLEQRYSYLVLDLSHDFSDKTLAGLDAADEILLVMAPDLASVSITVCALDIFETLGYARGKVRMVLNWTFQKQGLARKDIEAALKRPIDLVIPFAAESFVTAINLGIPPVIADPNGSLGAIFEDLAFVMSQDAQKRQKPKIPSEAWKRVVQRIRQRQQKR